MSIQTKALLMKCTIGTWDGTIKDNKALKDYLAQHKMSDDAGSMTKHLIAKSALKAITDEVNTIRNYHRSMTMPWNLDGVGLLLNERLLDYMAGIRELKQSFDVAVQNFLTHYDVYISDARLRLGDCFQQNEFPSKEYLATRFYVDISPLPIPTSEHLLTDLTDSGLDKSMIDKAVEDAQDKAMQRMWVSLYTRLRHFSNALEEGKTFKRTTIEKLDEHVNRLREFNFYADKKFESFMKFIEINITSNNADDIRKNKDVRSAVQKALAEALIACKPYIGEQNGYEVEEESGLQIAA